MARKHRDAAPGRGHAGPRKRVLPLVAMGATLCLAVLPGARTLVAQLGPLRYGVSTSAVASANPTDAAAASLLLARAMAQAVGAWSGAEGQLLSSPDGVVKAFGAGSVDVVAMSSMEYLSVEHALRADPFLVYEVSGEMNVEYVLLARAGVRSVADLAGRRIAVYNPSNQQDLADTWLDVLLLEAGLPEAARACREVRLVKKRSQAALALFFGQVDAAIEPLSSFQAASELNPQLGRELRIIARSAPFLPGVACVRRSLDAELRRRLQEKSATLHLGAQLRQTFIVMRVNRLVAFEPRYLDSTRALVDRYHALRRRALAR